MRIAFGAILFIHGFGHLPGFLAFWKVAKLRDLPYRTTIFAGAVDVGHAGIRVVGLLWLFAALVFMTAGIGAFARTAWWQPLTLGAAAFSLLLCLTGWPEAKIGLIINLAVAAVLLAGKQVGWW